MPEGFYKRIDRGFSVEIWSAEEMKNKPFTLIVDNDDIQRLTDSLTGDQDFTGMLFVLGVKPTSENISRIAEIILCHDTRCKTRYYGIEHH